MPRPLASDHTKQAKQARHPPTPNNSFRISHLRRKEEKEIVLESSGACRNGVFTSSAVVVESRSRGRSETRSSRQVRGAVETCLASPLTRIGRYWSGWLLSAQPSHSLSQTCVLTLCVITLACRAPRRGLLCGKWSIPTCGYGLTTSYVSL